MNTKGSNFFPFVIDLTGKKFMFVGGGKVTERKIKVLMRFLTSPDITVYSTNFTDHLKSLQEQNKISLIHTDASFIEDDVLLSYDFIIAATDDKMVNQRIVDLAMDRKKFYLNTSDKSKSNFFFPAVTIIDDLLIAISSLGRSPKKVKLFKKLLEGLNVSN
ncbi:MAG: bifunctional precorrin-2 dehydrogenase/sirohydrochlorin ferrochelatase [Calditerrivibrio sp.]|nr:bifunctional precorrin-2 dehydrogenase/sirohydrochlorin ferrochelatase [Calditerrivibrio sp.]